METGELMLTAVPITDQEGEDEMVVNRSSMLVLCTLPVDPTDAKDYFGLTRQRLEQLAPQVGWLILRMISVHAINSRKDAEARLASWLPYLTKHTHQLISERVRGYLT